MQMTYKTKGICASEIIISTSGEKVDKVSFIGGCGGNTQAVSRLVEGMKISDVIERLQSIKCGFKSTSCPDQLAQALKEISTKG